jgi:transposase, IS5 family
MQTPSNRTAPMLLNTEEELFNHFIKADHPFRKLAHIIDFPRIIDPLRALYSDIGTMGIDVEKGFKSLLIQFWEDYSDREMEKALQENVAVRWFCGFGLTEKTPDHSYFWKLRTRIGKEKLAYIFTSVNTELENQGLFGNVFTFIDASTIISKTALWEERDKALADGEETLNNAVVAKYAADKDARWGAKSKHKIWFGYKRHTSVDMRHGLVKNTLVTPANVPDFKPVKDICPNGGMVFLDKLYDCKEAYDALFAHNCHAATIRKNNNKTKNRDVDRWRSSIRMPFEGTFSKLSKRARYRSLIKVEFQNIFQSLCHNLKKAVTILPIPTTP